MYNIFSTPIVSLFETLLKGPGSQAVPAGTPADIPLGRSSPFSTFLGALGWDAPRGRGAEGTRGREPERPSCPWAEWPRGLESEGQRGRVAPSTDMPQAGSSRTPTCRREPASDAKL